MNQLLVLGVILLLGGAYAYNVKPAIDEVDEIEPYAFEDVINATIEAIRPLIPDPLRIENLTLTLPTEGLITGGANISNFELTGLQGFQIPYLHLAIIGMRLNFTFVLPSINLNTDYWLDVLLADLVPFYGQGKVNFHLIDGELQGSAQADLNGGIAIKNLRISLTVGSTTFDIHGALDNEDFSLILSSLLNDVVDTFIDSHQEVISNILSPIIEIILNAILAGGGETTTTTSTTTAAPGRN